MQRNRKLHTHLVALGVVGVLGVGCSSAAVDETQDDGLGEGSNEEALTSSCATPRVDVGGLVSAVAAARSDAPLVARDFDALQNELGWYVNALTPKPWHLGVYLDEAQREAALSTLDALAAAAAEVPVLAGRATEFTRLKGDLATLNLYGKRMSRKAFGCLTDWSKLRALYDQGPKKRFEATELEATDLADVSLPEGTEQKLAAVAEDLSTTWVDTIYEGDYVSDGDATLAYVTVYRRGQTPYAYGLTVSAPARYTGGDECEYNEETESFDSDECSPGTISESAHVTADFDRIEDRENEGPSFDE